MRKLKLVREHLVGKVIAEVIMDQNEITFIFDDKSMLTIEKSPVDDKLFLDFANSPLESLKRVAS